MQTTSFYGVTDGRIVGARCQLDRLGVKQQIGAAPASLRRQHPLR
ncbi:hypothetical protein [Streptomyces pseudovenezuelae]|nr:hypothetical protein [Streptomyces pseudovenezuelae]